MLIVQHVVLYVLFNALLRESNVLFMLLILDIAVFKSSSEIYFIKLLCITCQNSYSSQHREVGVGLGSVIFTDHVVVVTLDENEELIYG